MKINDKFTNKIHRSYNIRNIELKEDFKFLEKNILFENDNTIIYCPSYSSDVCFKIDKSLLYKARETYEIEAMISALADKQENVKLTEFPYGVVTQGRRVIGQEVRLYKEYEPLSKKVYSLTNEQFLIVCKKVSEIIKELINNDIYYLDIHEDNFLVNDDLDVKLIDFSYNCVIFCHNNQNESRFCHEKLESMFTKLSNCQKEENNSHKTR